MADEPVARTSLGDLRGVYTDGIAAFRGVPFAAPPIGELRFAPAAPIGAWNGQRDATRHGPIAPQLPSRLGVAMGNFSRPHNEDCLTLTICTPAPDGKARPVLVWLHGGAWISGAGSLDWYDGSRLAREGDIVFVGVNYRLGALGWLHRPGIVDVEAGTSDMIAALGWVRDHIAGFGGDPNGVTVMGQSAGATSIGRLLMLPAARSLFRRVIMQSGGFGRGAYTSAMATERADQLLHLLDIDPQASNALTRLRSVDVQHLLVAQGELARANARFAQTMPMFMPVLPSAMTQAEMLGAIADGADGKDVLIGATADEVHAFYAADPGMENPPTDALVARFGGEAALARYRARRPGGERDGPAGRSRHRRDIPAAGDAPRRGGRVARRQCSRLSLRLGATRFALQIVPLHRSAVRVRQFRGVARCGDAGGRRRGADGGPFGRNAPRMDRVRAEWRSGARGIAGLAAS